MVGRGAVAWWLKEELEAIRHLVFLPKGTENQTVVFDSMGHVL